jgi:hypothetical protein
MNKSLILATLLVAGGGSAVVGANSGVTLRGSDTLFDFTSQLLKSCPGSGTAPGSTVYQGGGSAVGQSAMVAGTQQVAPMTRPLNNGGGICTTVKLSDGGAVPWGTTSAPDGAVIPNLSGAAQIVIGLDGVEFFGSKNTIVNDAGGATACNQDDNANCDPNASPGSAAFDTTIAGYTFNGWRDVLRVLLAGFDHTNTGTNAAAWAARDCNSVERNALASSYGSLFENNCTAAHGDATTGAGVCTSIRHVFRRDDFSGTTDTVLTLLGLPSAVTPGTVGTPVSGGSTITVDNTGADVFCNAVRPAFVYPSASVPTALQGSDATFDPTSSATVAGTAGTAPIPVGTTSCGNPTTCAATAFCFDGRCVTPCTVATSNCTAPLTCVANAAAPAPNDGFCSTTTRETAVYRSTMQDNDPIRRQCFGSGAGTAAAEDVCAHSGDLGLVLPINDVPEETLNPARTNADRYNANPCVKGHLISVTAPEAYDAISLSQTKQICTRTLLCPNGDKCNNLGGCIAPADTNGNVQCLASKLTAPAITISAVAVPAVHPIGPGIAEGRAYNQHLYVQVGSAGGYQNSGFIPVGGTTGLGITGAFYRIHTSHSLSTIPNSITGANRTCQFPVMSDQMGCLVEASPCSFGYDGRGATANFAQNDNVAMQPINLNKQSPDILCIQGNPGASPPIAGFTYPLSRKIYLGTVQGFANVTGDELQLTGCETDLAQTGATATPGGLMTTNAASAITKFGFIDIAPTVHGGEPYCEDFNEQVVCGQGSNVNGCPSTVPANFSNFPTFSTTCGDGHVDPYEDCDPGAPLPAADPTCVGGAGTCSATCRCQ